MEHGTVSDKLAQQLKFIHLILGRPLHSRYDLKSYGAGKNPLPMWVLRESRHASYWQSPLLNIGTLKVNSIESNGKTPVYDIEVADNHNFILANGILAHNCANRAFLLTSLAKNELPYSGQVYCVMGVINSDGGGDHAWVEAQLDGRIHILEATITDKFRAIIPVSCLDIYESKVYFDEDRVYTVGDIDVAGVINKRFELRDIPFLANYLCGKCLALEGA